MSVCGFEQHFPVEGTSAQRPRIVATSSGPKVALAQAVSSRGSFARLSTMGMVGFKAFKVGLQDGAIVPFGLRTTCVSAITGHCAGPSLGMDSETCLVVPGARDSTLAAMQQ